ncbi:hypothetical protein [Pseudomonas sp. FW305-70]|uniref:hypothetical protein n=1 Tax=Pseudomonas sp. FW305-70 TaxID=2751342 RepID=UPI0011AECFF7|nr:hypothetical protein [Pseudomonas sp. FW305-70]
MLNKDTLKLHLTVMTDTGTHFSVFLVTPTNIIKFTRYLRRFFQQRLGYIPDYHLFWFATPEGFVVTLSAGLIVRRSIEEFYRMAVERNYITTASPLYIGSSVKTLTKTLNGLAESHTPLPNKHSYGGSALTGDNK